MFLRYLCLGTQLLLDVRLEIFWLLRAGPSSLDLAVLANQELLKVPLDTLETHESWLLVLEPLECGISLGAVDVDLSEDREGYTIVDLAEGLDFVVC